MGPLVKIKLTGKPAPSEEGSGEYAMDEGEEDGDMGAAKVAAAQGILDAIKSRDAQALSDALEEHYACCGGEEE